MSERELGARLALFYEVEQLYPARAVLRTVLRPCTKVMVVPDQTRLFWAAAVRLPARAAKQQDKLIDRTNSARGRKLHGLLTVFLHGAFAIQG